MSKTNGRDLMSEAVSDAKSLRDTALEAAKNEIVEAMTPAIKNLVEKNLRGALPQNESANRIRRGIQDNWPGESHTGFEESKDKGDNKMAPGNEKEAVPELDMESLAGFFPSVSEVSDELDGEPQVDENGMPIEAAGIPQLGEGEKGEGEGDEGKEGDDDVKEGKKDKEEDAMDETIEISESELKKVYEAALKTEATVTKGFGDMTAGGEIDDVIKDVDKSVADVKKGEHVWEKETPPAKQDFTVKEMVQRGLAENKALRENLKKAVGIIRQLGTKLHEVNLFNAKVLHVNRLLNKHTRMTSEQKKVVLESIDKAQTITQVKMVFEAIDSSIVATQSLTEGKSRKPTTNAQRARTSGAPNQTVLSESVDRNSHEAGSMSRLQELAGLIK